MNIDFNKHIWEGWTVGDFIRDISVQIDLIMTHRSHRQPFTSKKELAQWCKSHQSYYKKRIPEVNRFFADKYGLH